MGRNKGKKKALVLSEGGPGTPASPVGVSPETILGVNKRILKSLEFGKEVEGGPSVGTVAEEIPAQEQSKSTTPIAGSHPNMNPPQFVQKARSEISTYRDALAGNIVVVNGLRLRKIEGIRDGIIEFTKKEVEATMKQWKLSLLGMVVGEKISYSAMKNFVASRWTGIHQPKIILHDSGIFIFKFCCESYLSFVLEQGPWLLGGLKPLALKRWVEGIKLNPSCFKTTTVWATFPDLDLRFWDEEFYCRMGSAIGTPILTDSVTLSQERLSFARILIEIDANENLRDEITFRGEDGEIVRQKVLYEWIPDVCETCHVFGHKTGECRTTKDLHLLIFEKGKPSIYGSERVCPVLCPEV